MLYFLGSATFDWYIFDQNKNGLTEVGGKATFIIGGLSMMFGALALSGAAAMIKLKAPACFFIGLALYFMQFSTIIFASYDTIYGDQTNEDTIRAGIVFQALFGTISWIVLFASAGFFFTDGSPKAAVAFVFGVNCIVFVSMVGAWGRLDEYNKGLDGESVSESGLKALVVFPGLAWMTAVFGFFGAAGLSAKSGENINFYDTSAGGKSPTYEAQNEV